MAEFPRNDAEFQTAINERMTYIIPLLAKWGLVGGDIAPAQAAIGNFNTSFLTHNNSQAAALSDRQIKDVSRNQSPGGAEPEMRALSNRIGAHPGCDNGDRAALGIPIPGAPPPAPPAESTPQGTVGTEFPLRHDLSWIDSLTHKLARPNNARAAEIWVAIVAAGAGQPPIESFTFFAQDSESPNVKLFTSADIGKTAYYAFRWILKDGTEGPWGEIVSATVVG